MKNNKFYKILTLFIFLSIILGLFLKPPTFNFKNKDKTTKEYVLLKSLSLKNRIDKFYQEEDYYPYDLKTFQRYFDLNLDSLFEYQSFYRDYRLKLKYSFDDTFLVFTKDTILKEVYEK
uniref:Uncharacterized protein n=1 Tax=candidate division WOR-3 bacterium TaxID=2052148 RepID=A0A7C3N8C6_UNCW3